MSYLRKKYQLGGKAPIYTSNPNDPRLRAALSKLHRNGVVEDGEYEGDHIDMDVINHLRQNGYDVDIL
jgi:hypothetical protein